MKKTLGVAIACLAIAGAIPSTASAASRHHQQREQFMENYCSGHNDSDCRSWRHDRGSWDDARYHSWYRHHHHDFEGDDAAAALFGFAAGTAAGLITGTVGAATGEPACVNYRSYNPADDTYLGRDGYRHECH